MTQAAIVGFVESGQRLVESQKREWNPRDLLAAAERAELRNTGWPIGLVLQGSGKRPVPTPDGIEARLGRYALGQTEDYWYFHKDGNYYVSRLFEEDLETLQWTSSQGHPESAIWFDIRIWRIAEIILHSATIYRELGIPPEEPYYLAINHKGLEGRELYVSNPVDLYGEVGYVILLQRLGLEKLLRTTSRVISRFSLEKFQITFLHFSILPKLVRKLSIAL